MEKILIALIAEIAALTGLPVLLSFAVKLPDYTRLEIEYLSKFENGHIFDLSLKAQATNALKLAKFIEAEDNIYENLPFNNMDEEEYFTAQFIKNNLDIPETEPPKKIQYYLIENNEDAEITIEVKKEYKKSYKMYVID